jgi:3-hydroxy-3-methylglutaryl CoA synthase/uncharacterized OB-fold protein
MGVEAARLAMRAAGDTQPIGVAFATANPAYLDKTNATTIHAALRLDTQVAAYDFGGAVRSSMGSLIAALSSDASLLIVSADARDGLPTSADESGGGDGAAAVVTGTDADGTVIAEFVSFASANEEFIDRWRVPGETRSKQWEERFGEMKYVPLGQEALENALKSAELSADQIDKLIVTGAQPRAVRAILPRLGVDKEKVVDDLSGSVGWTGTAHPLLLLTSALETAEPGQVIAVLSLTDGADCFVFRATDAIKAWMPTRTVEAQIGASGQVPYGKFLAWRGTVKLDPPRRPEPYRISASIAGRREAWKYGFVGSKDRSSGAVHLPPAHVSMKGGAVDEMEPAPTADELGTVAAFTIDRIAYSPSPPIVFAVVDFDAGGRAPVELCDLDADALQMGDRVEMTFRRLYSADGIHNYFWKARPLRGA